MSISNTNWKQKYLDSLDKLEKMESRWVGVEELLRAGLTRVAIAAQGVDQTLDKQLNSLRKSIRSGNYVGLERIVDDISDSVKRLDEQRKEGHLNALSTHQILLTLCESIDFPPVYKKRVKLLKRQLSNNDRNNNIEDILNEFSQILNDSLHPVSPDTSPRSGNGLLRRLFAGTHDDNHFAATLDALGNLINAIQWSETERERVSSMHQSLTELEQPSELSEWIHSLATVINTQFHSNSHTSATTSAKQTFVDYSTLTQSLQKLVNLLIKRSTLPHESLVYLSKELQHPMLLEQIETVCRKLTEIIQQLPASNNDADALPNTEVSNSNRLWHHWIDNLNPLLKKLPNYSTLEEKIYEAHSTVQRVDIIDELCNALITLLSKGTPSDSAALENDAISLQFSKFCLQLLDSIRLPDDLAEQSHSVRDHLIKGIKLDKSSDVLDKVTYLVSATRARLEKEKTDLKNFLLQMSSGLNDIDQHLERAEDQRKTAAAEGMDFNKSVENHVNDLEVSMQDASELKQLKQSVQQTLVKVRQNLLEYRQDETQRQAQLEKKLTQTNQRIRQLEAESQTLRKRIELEHSQAVHDPLTGIHNRLAYEERLAQEFARWQRYQKSLALLIFDIDHFKAINDTYGHKAGDKAIILIAKCLSSNLRETDFLARYGGEEFIILMPETGLQDALAAAEKLRIAVQSTQLHYQQQHVNITISAGVTVFKSDDSPSTAFLRADKALYCAKQYGRNRCHSFD